MTATSSSLPSITLLTHADSDLIALRRAVDTLPADFPPVSGYSLQSLAAAGSVATLLDGPLADTGVIVLRLLGQLGAVAGLTELARQAEAQGRHVLALSGAGDMNPELASISSVPAALLHDVLAYFQHGGVPNLAQGLRFLSDHLLLTGYGYALAQAMPDHGIYHPDLANNATLEQWRTTYADGRPVIGVLFYRAQWLSGNTAFVDALVEAVEKQGCVTLPVYTASLRSLDEHGRPLALSFFHALGAVDALINTTAFAMGEVSSDSTTSGAWSAAALTELDVPMVQAIPSGMTEAEWRQSSRGLNPLDTAMNVVLPEFDGRVIAVPISFKAKRNSGSIELVEYQPVADRIRRAVGVAVRLARLRRVPNSEKRIVFVLTNSGAKADQVGNAVGLDAPASLLTLLQAMHNTGYHIEGVPDSSDAIIHALLDRCSYDENYLTQIQCDNAVGAVSAEDYARWFAELPSSLQQKMTTQWGDAPGEAYVHRGHLVFAGLEFGNALVVLQPPRGYGMDPDAIYHQPDLPPTHHYYAFYRWLRDGWHGDAIVHLGKHGTLEWLPGKGVGLSEECFPDALLGDMPLFYPFIINDPGEGAQAKRRAHAVVVDHLTPPMTSADTYGPLAKLERLVDEYYQLELLDPSKLPLLREQVWELVHDANLDTDLEAILAHEHEEDDEHDDDHHHELEDMDGVEFAHLIEHLDGYLCEIGAAQIRGGLHRFGLAPEGEALVDMLYALTRLPNQTIPGLPDALAEYFDLDLAQLLEDKGKRLDAVPEGLQALAGRPVVTRADALEALADVGRGLYAKLAACGFDVNQIEAVIEAIFQPNAVALSGTEPQPCAQAPSPAGEGWGEENKNTAYSPHPSPNAVDLSDAEPSPSGRGQGEGCLKSPHPNLLPEGIGIYTSIQGNRNNGLQNTQAPSPAGEGWGEENKNHCLLPSSQPSPGGRRGWNHLCRYPCPEGEGAHLLKSTVSREHAALVRVLAFACRELVPNLNRTVAEIDNLLHGLEGRYVPAGPSGSPTRGMAQILPTGRNFYSVDPRALPSPSAWRVGQQLADEVLRRHQKETGRYPESVALTVWGTSAMRTHGDDVAEVLALLGVQPRWQAESGRLSGVAPVSLAQLGRPRIDVTVRISGFFRDAFPQLVELIDQAVAVVVTLDESAEDNYVRKHYLEELHESLGQGESPANAERRARYRIFGAKPGSYGAGILPLIQEKNWQDSGDFAEAYVNWGGYAYGEGVAGVEAKVDFRHRLGQVEVALHNQDNREHDIFDSDDYLQFHGGMIAAIRNISGHQPRRYFGDSHDPRRAVVRDLKEETLRVFRSRVVNPKWLDGIRQHGYKGGLELAATVDYLFGYDATAGIMDDWMYQQTAEHYLFDPVTRAFLQESNPWALKAMAERLLEAAERQLWREPSQETLAKLRQLYLQGEADLEGRG